MKIKRKAFITLQTKAVYVDKDANYRTEILEGRGKKYCHKKPEQIIERSCIVNGTTIALWRELIIQIFGIHNKIPIPVDPIKGIFMFPTCSTRSENCVWLSYYHIANLEPVGSKETIIHFKDGTNIYIQTSCQTIWKQQMRTSQIIAKFSSRFYPGFGPL